MNPLETIYLEHHTARRGEFRLINGEERGHFLMTQIGKGKKVLDVGCRDGALTRYFVEGNDVTGVDIDSSALDRAHQTLGIPTLHTDLNGAWDVGSDYDVVVACEILEHLYYPDQVLKKIRAVLRSGGMLIGSVPHAFSLQSRLRYLFGRKKNTALSDPTHINHFTASECTALLREAGFKDIEVTTIVSGKFKLLSFIFPYTFAHSLLFTARTP